MVQVTSIQAQQTQTLHRETEARSSWLGREVASLKQTTGSGSAGGASWDLSTLFWNAVLPLAVIFGAVFTATTSFAVAGITTASVAVAGLFVKHVCGL